MSNDPFVGTWIMDPSRSEFDPNHRPREATMIFAVDAEGWYVMSAEGKDERGEACAEKPQRFVADGQSYPVPELKGLTSVSTRPSPNRLETTVRREDGSIVGQAIMEISADGRSLAATNRGFDTQLREFRQVTVWDRQ